MEALKPEKATWEYGFTDVACVDFTGGGHYRTLIDGRGNPIAPLPMSEPSSLTLPRPTEATMGSEADDHFDDEPDGVTCPKCMGDGVVDCYCGGDLCVCTNYGERDCPVCYGEGEVSEDRERKFRDNQREWAEAFRKAWEDKQ